MSGKNGTFSTRSDPTERADAESGRIAGLAWARAASWKELDQIRAGRWIPTIPGPPAFKRAFLRAAREAARSCEIDPIA